MKYEGYKYKIGPVIRDIRKDKGLLIEEVAAKTGISVSTLGQVEQGRKKPEHEKFVYAYGSL